MKSPLRTLVAILVCGVFLFVFANAFSGPCSTRCNVILIMTDTLSGNHLKTYGYDRDTMPLTTSFFEKNGIIFDNATSNSTWTLPSFTGMYFSDIGSNVSYKELDDASRPNLPQELRDNGFTVRATRPQGDNFIFDAITRLYKAGEVTPADETHRGTAIGKILLNDLVQSDKPFFLLVHTFEAHEPYMPDEPYNSYFENLSGYEEVTAVDLANINQHKVPADAAVIHAYELRYDEQVAQTDAHVASFIASIPPETLEHTVVIWAADHGEAFYEHGGMRHGTNGLYQEEAHIPLMMYVPGVSPRRIAEPVSLMDMAPTILSFAHIPVPKTFKGESMVPLLSGHSLGARAIPIVTGIPSYLNLNAPPPPTLAAAGAVGIASGIVPPDSIGVRLGMEKLFTYTSGPKKGTWEWYDLAKDPAEKNNLATDTASLPQNLLSAVQALESEAKR